MDEELTRSQSDGRESPRAEGRAHKMASRRTEEKPQARSRFPSLVIFSVYFLRFNTNA